MEQIMRNILYSFSAEILFKAKVKMLLVAANKLAFFFTTLPASFINVQAVFQIVMMHVLTLLKRLILPLRNSGDYALFFPYLLYSLCCTLG